MATIRSIRVKPFLGDDWMWVFMVAFPMRI
jgi:hypothetical protein